MSFLLEFFSSSALMNIKHNSYYDIQYIRVCTRIVYRNFKSDFLVEENALKYFHLEKILNFQRASFRKRLFQLIPDSVCTCGE